MTRRMYQLSPQTIELLVALEGMGATTTNALAAKLERTAAVVEARLSALLVKRLVTVDRTHRPRRYAVAPGWRGLIDAVQKTQDVQVAPTADGLDISYAGLPPPGGDSENHRPAGAHALGWALPLGASMTADEKIALLQTWQSAIEQADAEIEPIVKLMKLPPNSPVSNAVWGLQDAVTRIAAQAVGDTGEWLSWYAGENQMGAKKMRVGFGVQCLQICTLADLLWVVEGCGRGKS